MAIEFVDPGTFLVQWTARLDAAGPYDAAEKAMDLIRGLTTPARAFVVWKDPDGGTNSPVFAVDLLQGIVEEIDMNRPGATVFRSGL